jgi:ankyrin repeat protein
MRQKVKFQKTVAAVYDRRKFGVQTFVCSALVMLACYSDGVCGEIHDAAKAGDLEKVKVLLRKNPDLVNEKGEYGWTALQFAVHSNRKEMVKLLLENKSDVNATEATCHDGTPLHIAAFSKDRAMAEILLAYNADVGSKDEYGRTPLHQTAYLAGVGSTTPAIAVAKLLLDHKADIEAKDNNGDTILNRVERENTDFAQFLLANKADVHTKNKHGWTPLHGAAINGDAVMVKFFLKNKAEVDAKEEYGRTPLHLAVSQRNKEVVEILLANNADVNARDNSGQTALDTLLKQEMFGRAFAFGGNEAARNQTLREINDFMNFLRKHGAKE